MSDVNSQIILAALQAAGPVVEITAEERATAAADAKVKLRDPQTEWDQRVKSLARSIKVMLREDSGISQQLSALDKCITEDDERGKVFRATIVSVGKEASSTRGIITLFTGTDREAKDSKGTILPAGHEQVRTERTDNPDGRAIARLAQTLIGHKAAVYIELQPMGGNRTGKVRVLQHIEDLGLDAEHKQLAAA